MSALFLSLFLLFQTNASDTIKVESEVASATVFLSGAQVNRTASVNLQPGTNHIAFVGLSPSLDGNTIQLQTDADIVLESLANFRDRSYQGGQAAQIETLKKQKAALEDSIQQVQASQTVLDRKLNVLISNQDISGNNSKISAVELRQAIDYFEEQFQLIADKRLELKSELQQLNGQLTKINQQIRELENKQARTSEVIEMAVHSETAQTVTFDLSYLVPAARWYPSYDIRVTEAGEPLTLTYKANIRQSSGVDWQNVTLAVSSAQPQRSSVIPKLNPIYLRFFETRPQPRAAVEMQEAEKALDLNEPMPKPVQTQLQEGQTAFTFDIENPYTIKTGAAAKTIAVESTTLPAEYEYTTIPKKQTAAYLTAKITDWETLNLLPGKANLFLSQSYVGDTQLNATTAQDTLSFSLGRDKGIVVERSPIESFEEKNFFGNRVTETKGWEITIRNTKSRPIAINITDQVPVSTNEDIDVDLTERSGAEFNESTGKLSWHLKVQPSQAQTLRFIYEITYPSGKQIIQHENRQTRSN